MKSSTDFQTGSILLLAATLVCIGLAITVIAPIIGSPLARSTVAQTGVSQSPAKESPSPRTSLAEFYPPIARAHHELSTSGNRPDPAIRIVNNQSRAFPASTPVTTAKELVSTGTESGFGSLLTKAPPSPTEAANQIANSEHNSAFVEGPLANDRPPFLPPGSVYAPITIQQPAAQEPSQNQNLPVLAERIERLVTERERLAAALEIERDRQAHIAQLEQRKHEADFQRQHIENLEKELKSLGQAMVRLQSETSTKLSRIEQQNSQIDVASQALNAYREALEIAKANSARSAERRLPPRTAELDRQPESRPQSQSDQDNTGRVRIPELPPMPSHQHGNPAPMPAIEQKPQTAEAPRKRLRVSSPVRTFKAPETDPEPKFLPLPSAEDQPLKSSSQTAVEPQSSTSLDKHSEMQFVPLDAPIIREFQSSSIPSFSDKPTTVHKQDRTSLQASVQKPVVSRAVPDLDVAFEHTYDFNSAPIRERGEAEMDASSTKVAALPRRLDSRMNGRPPESQFKLEPIEFPDLSIIERTPNSQLKVPDMLKPVAPHTARVNSENRVVTKAASKQDTAQKSWLQKLSGTFTQPAVDGQAKMRQTQSGGRGKNRHVQRKPAEQGGLIMSLGRRRESKSDTAGPPPEKPGMLQRISHTFRGWGKSDDR